MRIADMNAAANIIVDNTDIDAINCSISVFPRPCGSPEMSSAPYIKEQSGNQDA
jgi:hypothetical protein